MERLVLSIVLALVIAGVYLYIGVRSSREGDVWGHGLSRGALIIHCTYSACDILSMWSAL